MPPPFTQLSLQGVAEHLVKHGPVKYERANRRVRGILHGKYLFDTLDAFYVWEHPYFPFFYIPRRDIEGGPEQNPPAFTWVSPPASTSTGQGFWLAKLSVGTKTIEVAGFEEGPLAGLVKFPHNSLDGWYAEDERLLGSHPKDPYKRIDCLSSSREVRVEVDGIVVALSKNNIFLHETGLKTRYYISPTSILDWSQLIPSITTSVCPYKGQANYYHLRVGDKMITDAIWYYSYPASESAPIHNHLCFYDEKVDVFVDGVKAEDA